MTLSLKRIILALVEVVVRGGISAALVMQLPARLVACAGDRGMSTNAQTLAVEVVLITVLMTLPFAAVTLLLRRVVAWAPVRALTGGAVGLLLVFFFLHWGAGTSEALCVNTYWMDFEYAVIAASGGFAAVVGHLLGRRAAT